VLVIYHENNRPIGGTSWVSTAEYYRIINERTNKRLGGLNSAKILLYSVNFEEFKPPAKPTEWGEVGVRFTKITQRLEEGGADCLLLCANTPHMVANVIQSNIRIPLLHITEMTAREITRHRISKVGLLGTRITMEQSFFTEKLSEQGIQSIIPNEGERAFVHSSVFQELTKGIFKKDTKERFLQIIDGLKKEGAMGIILGCTEFLLLVKQTECDLPLFDTTSIHASSAVDFSLGGSASVR
jgi:aspartate racemase